MWRVVWQSIYCSLCDFPTAGIYAQTQTWLQISLFCVYWVFLSKWAPSRLLKWSNHSKYLDDTIQNVYMDQIKCFILNRIILPLQGHTLKYPNNQAFIRTVLTTNTRLPQPQIPPQPHFFGPLHSILDCSTKGRIKIQKFYSHLPTLTHDFYSIHSFTNRSLLGGVV